MRVKTALGEEIGQRLPLDLLDAPEHIMLVHCPVIKRALYMSVVILHQIQCPVNYLTILRPKELNVRVPKPFRYVVVANVLFGLLLFLEILLITVFLAELGKQSLALFQLGVRRYYLALLSFLPLFFSLLLLVIFLILLRPIHEHWPWDLH